MNSPEDDALLAVLSAAKRAAEKAIYEHYERRFESDWSIARANIDLTEVQAPIVTELTAHPVFRNGARRSFRAKQLMLQPNYIARNLLSVAVDTDPATTLAWLYRIFDINRTDKRVG